MLNQYAVEIPTLEMSTNHLFTVSETRTAHSKFSENTRTEKVVDRSGKPEERNSSDAQIRTLLEEQRQMISQNILRKSVITNSKQLMQKKSADFYEKNYGDRNCNFVKFINKVSQKWEN